MNENKMKYLYTAAMVALTLIVGIAALFCIKKYDVHAEETDELDGWIEVYAYQGAYSDNGVEKFEDIILYMKYQDFDVSKMCLIKRASGYEWYSSKSSVAGKDLPTISVGHTRNSQWVSQRQLPGGLSPVFNAFYIFDSEDTASGYIKGTVPASSAVNYEEANKAIADIEKTQKVKDATYSSDVPAPDKLYIQSLSSVSVTSVWQYTDQSVDLEGMTYEVKVEHYYMTTSLLASIAKGASGKEGEKILNVSATIDSTQRMIVKDTVEGYLEAPTKLLADQLLVSEDVEKKTGQMQFTNMLVSSPTDYSGKFAASGNAFFTGATSAHQAEYCGTQITVTPYKEIDGQMVKGNVCVARRFTSDILNNIGGSSYTQIGQDDAGNEFISKSNAQDGNGNDISLIKDNTDLSDVNADSVIKYIRDGFGILGNNGILEMSKTFFSEVPWYIWSLIAMIIGVNIVVIIFKIVRGM